MNIFEGLRGYEIILAALGSLLFLVLLFVLIVYVLRNKSLKGLLPFFLLPVLMIGFPAIGKIRYYNGVIELEKQVAAVNEHPNDTNAVAALKSSLADVEQRPASSGQTHLLLAKAQLALGQNTKALSSTEAALKAQPTLTEATRLGQQVRVETLATAMRRNPRDLVSARALTNEIAILERHPATNSETHLTLATAYLALGETNQARTNLNRAVRMRSNSPQATRLLKTIEHP